MKIKVNKFILFLCLLSLLGTVLVYDQLPEKVPGHFNFKGEVDRYDSKVSLFFTGSLPLFIYLLMMFLPKIDPKRQSYLKHEKAYNIIQVVIVLFLIGMQWSIISISLAYDLNMGILVRVGVGVLFIIMGNYMGQIRHNYFFGIRTPWTLADERVWRKTHRVGGISFIISGVLLIVTSKMEGTLGLIIFIASIFIATLYPTIYSYIQYKRLVDK